MRPYRFPIFFAILISISLVSVGCKPNSGSNSALSYEDAKTRLDRFVNKIDWGSQPVARKAQVALNQHLTLEDTLPDIDQYAFAVVGADTPDHVRAEIFVSTEKSGSGTDGWMVEVASAFNRAGIKLGDGRVAQVSIRKIASGTGYQYIASHKYLPEGFSPSNHLWIEMVKAHGIAVSPISEQLVGNTAGVVMKAKIRQKLEASDGEVTIPKLVEAVVQERIAMGYTNPFASSTGLNFLVTVLSTFAQGDETRLLSDEVTSAFQAFQRGVPFVSLTTLQMRESVEHEGSLDAFIMEYQTFVNTTELKTGYTFIPFGIEHDNPLYGLGDLSADKREVLIKLAEFAGQTTYQDRATEFGFNQDLNYQPALPPPAGASIIQAQKLWKAEKDAGKPVVAVFLCDTSGSMDGSPLKHLKRALIDGSQFINPDNAIGLVTFDSHIAQVLPIRQFSLLHRSSFIAAVQDFGAEGKTAMYDGILVSLQLLIKAQQEHPESKLMLFVLTDGETNVGLAYADVAATIAGLKVPIYTIGYNADIAALKRLSSLNEAASLKADENDVVYRISALLNAEM